MIHWCFCFRQIEDLTKHINQLEMKINDMFDENDELRDRLGLDPKDKIDLTDYKKKKNVKEQEDRALNRILREEVRPHTRLLFWISFSTAFILTFLNQGGHYHGNQEFQGKVREIHWDEKSVVLQVFQIVMTLYILFPYFVKG